MTQAMTSTTTYQSGDLVFISFPFSTGLQAKRRPALVIFDAGDADIVLARVTTRLYQTPFDVPLLDWNAAGLLAASVVRLHKVATLERELTERRMGTVSSEDRARIAAVLEKMYGAW